MKKVGGWAIRLVNDNQVACSCVAHSVALPASLPALVRQQQSCARLLRLRGSGIRTHLQMPRQLHGKKRHRQRIIIKNSTKRKKEGEEKRKEERTGSLSVSVRVQVLHNMRHGRGASALLLLPSWAVPAAGNRRPTQMATHCRRRCLDAND